MAITVTHRGDFTSTATGDTTFSPASNLAAGSLAVLVIAADNSGANGTSNNITAVTDTNGNTWTKRNAPIYDNGAANEGAQGAIFETAMTGGTLTTGSTITVDYNGTGPPSDVGTLYEVVPTSGSFTITYVTHADGVGATTASPTITTGSITSGNLLIAAGAAEQGTTSTFTADSDTSNGNWSAQTLVEIGSGTAGMTLVSQYKVVTATATQTYNPVSDTTPDVVLFWIEYTEVASATDVLIQGLQNLHQQFGTQTAARLGGLLST